MTLRIVYLLLLLPILNAIDISFGFLYQDTINTFGYIKAVYIILLFITTACLLKLDKYNIYIYGLILYFLIISFFSSNFSHTIIELGKIISSLLVYILAYNFIQDKTNLRRLLTVYIWSSLIVILSYIAAQYLDIGSVTYSDEQILLPGGRIHGSMLLAYGSMVILYLIATYDKIDLRKITYIIILILSIILVLLTFRRASILAIICGYMIYGLYSRNNRFLIKYTFLIFILLIVLAPFYAENLINLYHARDAINSLTAVEFGRTRDLLFAINDIVNNGFTHFLFGIEFLNSTNYIGEQRGLHGDFTVLLHGSGLFGLSLYLLTLFKMFRIKLFYYKIYNDSELNALKYSFIASFFIISLSNQLLYVSILSHAFLLIGAINGVLKNNTGNTE